MCANSQSNWLNTIAVRASYILSILKRFHCWKRRKTGRVVYLPPGKNQNRNQFVFLSFGVDPLNWQSFIEIGEMACSTTARCSRGHALKLISQKCRTVHVFILYIFFLRKIFQNVFKIILIKCKCHLWTGKRRRIRITLSFSMLMSSSMNANAKNA